MGTRIATEVAAVIDGLPSFTAVDLEELLDSTPQTRGYSEERRARARTCIVARQLATLNHLDYVLCGGIQPLNDGGFDIVVYVFAQDASGQDPLFEATVDDVEHATEYTVARFQEWALRGQR